MEKTIFQVMSMFFYNVNFLLKAGLLFFALLLFDATSAQKRGEVDGVKFEQITLSQALIKIKKSKKAPELIFIDCYTTWCGPCKKMSDEVFTQKSIGEFFNANFLNLKIDMEKGEGITVAKEYNIKAYPTFLILDSDGKEINRIIGSSDGERFIEKVRRAMDSKNSPKNLRDRYFLNPSLDNAVDYLESLYTLYMTKEIEDFLVETFPLMPFKEKYSEKIWPYTAEALKSPDSPLFDLILNEKYIADKLIGRERLDAALCYGIKQLARNYILGLLKEADHNKIEAKVRYLVTLSINDPTAPYIVNIIHLLGEKDYDGIVGLLTADDELMPMSEIERRQVEWLIGSIKGIPRNKLIEYHKVRKEYYKINIQATENIIDMLSN